MPADYQKSFEDLLRSKSPKYYGRFEHLKELTKPSLGYWARTHPTFTPHGISHCESVIEFINTLVSDDQKRDFNSYEIFFLLSAAWLHDIGMTDDVGIPSEKNRPIHHLKTEEIIIKHKERLKLDEHEAIIIGDIAAGHRNLDLYDEQKYDNETAFKNSKVRKGFLAAILRLADEMDMSYFRIIGITPEIMTKNDQKQQKEIIKHRRISGIATNEDKTGIIVSAIVYNPTEYEIVEQLVEELNGKLNEIKPLLKRYGLKYQSVDNKTHTRGFLSEKIRLELDKEKIIDLLIGRTLYDREDVALRELIQNSIDACIRLKHQDPESDPNISIEFDEEKLIVTDTGIGMTRDEAKDFLSRIGSSISTVLAENEEQFNIIGKFGIGFLSCYLISDQIEIWTKTTNEKGRYYKINCNEGINSGWLPKEYDHDEIGTKICLELNERGKNIDWKEALNHFVKDLEFKIIVNGKNWTPLLQKNINLLTSTQNISKETLLKVIPSLKEVKDKLDLISDSEISKIQVIQNRTSRFHWKLIMLPKKLFDHRILYESLYVDFGHYFLFHGINVMYSRNFFANESLKGFFVINFLDVDLELNVSREAILINVNNDLIILDLLYDVLNKLAKLNMVSLSNCIDFIRSEGLLIDLTKNGRMKILKFIKDSDFFGNIPIKFFINGKEEEIPLSKFFTLSPEYLIFLTPEFSSIYMTDQTIIQISKIIGRNIPVFNLDHSHVSYYNSKDIFEDFSGYFFLILNDSPQKAINIEYDEIFYLCEDYKMGINSNYKTIEIIAKKYEIPCFSLLLNFTPTIRSNFVYIIRSSTIKKLSIKNSSAWNLNHPFFEELSKLDKDVQKCILEKFAKLTKAVKRRAILSLDYYSDIIESYCELLCLLRSIKSLQKYCKNLLTRSIYSYDWDETEPIKFNLLDLYQSITLYPKRLLESYSKRYSF